MRDVGRVAIRFTAIHHGGKEYLHPGVWQHQLQPLLYTDVVSCPSVTSLATGINNIGLPRSCAVSASCCGYQILPSAIPGVISWPTKAPAYHRPLTSLVVVCHTAAAQAIPLGRSAIPFVRTMRAKFLSAKLDGVKIYPKSLRRLIRS